MMQTICPIAQKSSATGISVETSCGGTFPIFGENITTMIEITHADYLAVAGRLAEEIGAADYYNGTVETACDGFCSQLTATLIIYRSDCSDGISVNPVSDIVPVWWEFHTTLPDGSEVINDFSFSTLKEHLLE